MPATITIIAMLTAAAASGLLGSFALMRRMTLAADSLSPVALPGIGIAVLLNVSPIIGGFAALIIGALIIWSLEQKTRIATEALIGVIFSAALALGILIATPEELLDLLFGNYHTLTALESIIGLGISILIIGALLFLKDRLTLSILSPSLAKTMGINNSALNLIFLILFAADIMLGLKFLGVLLMGSLIIIPAAAAKNFAKNLPTDVLASAIIAVLSTALGLLIAVTRALELGPVVVTVAAGLFFFSFLFLKPAR